MTEPTYIVCHKRAALRWTAISRIAALLLLVCLGSGVAYSQNLEVEPNGTASQATPISSGNPIQGASFDSSDRDYYRLALASRQEVTVSLATSERRSGYPYAMDILVSIYDASQSKIGGFTSAVAAPLDSKLIAGPGDIYISISNRSGSNLEGKPHAFPDSHKRQSVC